MIATKKTKTMNTVKTQVNSAVSILLTGAHVSHSTGLPCGEITVKIRRLIKHCKSVVQLFSVPWYKIIENRRKNFQMLINDFNKEDETMNTVKTQLNICGFNSTHFQSC